MIRQELNLTPRIKATLYSTGTLLFVLSLIYLAVFSVRHWHGLKQLPSISPVHVAIAVALYGTAHFTSAAAWVRGLQSLGQPMPFFTGIRIALVSQIGKYLPGNVVHYVARAGLASASGINLANSGISTITEILANLFGAALVVSATMLLDPAPIDGMHVALAGGLMIPAVLGSIIVLVATALLHFTSLPMRSLLAASVCFVGSFILVGLSFFIVVSSVSHVAPSPFGAIGIYAVAWTAGYVVPGAPAGLGMREVILVAWLTPMIGGGPAIACSLLHRVVSTCVDALVAIIGYGWLRVSGRRLLVRHLCNRTHT